MATDMKYDMNATGYGSQDLRSEDGGNSTRGMLDQIRPAGIIATGGQPRGGGDSLRMGKGRKGSRGRKRK